MNAKAFRIAVGIHSMANLQVKDICGEEHTCALHTYPKQDASTRSSCKAEKE